MKSNIIGLLLIGLVIIGAIVLGGSYKLFINIPSLIIVFGITIGGLIYRFGFGGLTLFTSQNNTRLIYCQYGKFLSIISGLLGTVIGIIQCFFNINDFSKAGDAFAISFLTLFYGFLLALIFHLLERNFVNEDANHNV